MRKALSIGVHWRLYFLRQDEPAEMSQIGAEICGFSIFATKIRSAFFVVFLERRNFSRPNFRLQTNIHSSFFCARNGPDRRFGLVPRLSQANQRLALRAIRTPAPEPTATSDNVSYVLFRVLFSSRVSVISLSEASAPLIPWRFRRCACGHVFVGGCWRLVGAVDGR